MSIIILNKKELQDWDKLRNDYAHLCQNQKHQEKKDQFLLSRQALKICLESFQITMELPQLELLHHSVLKNNDRFVCSLSHTKDNAAAMVEEARNFLSVGIDIERSERKINPAIILKIKNISDEWDDLFLWTAKEAAYKCLSNYLKKEISHPFSQIIVTKNTWKSIPYDKEGSLEVSTHGEVIVAQARLKA